MKALGGAPEVQFVGEGDHGEQVGGLECHNDRLSDKRRRFIGQHRRQSGTLEGMYLAHSRRRIAIDMDEVLADALTEHLTRVYERLRPPVHGRSPRGRSVEDIVEPHELERAYRCSMRRSLRTSR